MTVTKLSPNPKSKSKIHRKSEIAKIPPNAMLAGLVYLVAHWRLELQTP